MQVNTTHRSVPGAAEPATGGCLAVISSVAAAWVLSIGFDLFLHAGVLAHLYAEPSPFLLPAEEAFRRIPLGYLTFLVLSAALFWLLRRLDVRGALAGFRSLPSSALRKSLTPDTGSGVFMSRMGRSVSSQWPYPLTVRFAPVLTRTTTR